MTARRLLPLAIAFLVGSSLGTGYVYANHPWICSGTTAYHYTPRTVGYNGPSAETSVSRPASAYTGAYTRSINIWNPTVINLTSGGTKLQLRYGAYGTNGWLGLATISGISSCHIGLGKSQLNDTYLRNTGTYSQTAVDHVACQEVGHTFGLNHNRTSSTTCMNDTILTAGAQINQHDRDLLSSIYAHVPN
ncbi:MAG TPA: zinc-dependent metalloprotease [Thermoanaerobaculia bacterium]|nr:zinc-dependent metalloprotease [Thermoanaerobaculia bacterium]